AMPMPDLRHWATHTPDRPAVISPSGSRTFAELDADVNRVARALRTRGLVAGDAVALLASNHLAFVETYYACLRAGFRLTPVNWHLPGEEGGYIGDAPGARAWAARAAAAAVAEPCLASARRCTIALVAGGAIDGFASFEAAMAAETPEPLNDPVLGTTMLYTS